MLRHARRALALLGAALGLAVLSGALDVDLASSAPAHEVRVTVAPAAPLDRGALVPPSFLGLSTEYWTLPLYGRELPIVERAIALLHVAGGPTILRIGGDSADHSFWVTRTGRPPAWAYPLTPRWARLIAAVVRRLGLRVIFDLNLISDSPRTAARWAAAAMRLMPRGSVIGFEVGNEPDIYSHRVWRAMTAGRLPDGRSLPPTITPGTYVEAFRRYARLLGRVAPGVPLIAPALANPRAHERWLRALLASHPLALGVVSVHRYPFSGCSRHRRLPSYPTVPRLLGARATEGVVASITPALRAAARAGLPLRLTELNSVSCGGRRGVSNTFATSLWAPDVLFALLEQGVVGVNLHVRADTINAPFAVGPRGLDARPLLYGLLMFARALGPGARIVPLRLDAARRTALDAWAVQWGDRLHLVLIDKGRWAARVRVIGVGAAPGRLQRLLAPSPRAEGHITLAGQHLSRAASWIGRRTVEAIPHTRSGYTIVLPRFSAALATIPLGAPAGTR